MQIKSRFAKCEKRFNDGDRVVGHDIYDDIIYEFAYKYGGLSVEFDEDILHVDCDTLHRRA